MANELVMNYPTGSTLYALLFDAVGRVWNGSAFEAPVAGSWANYDLALTEVATTFRLCQGAYGRPMNSKMRRNSGSGCCTRFS